MKKDHRKLIADQIAEVTLDLDGIDQLGLVGPADANLRFIADRFGGSVTVLVDRPFEIGDNHRGAGVERGQVLVAIVAPAGVCHPDRLARPQGGEPQARVRGVGRC